MVSIGIQITINTGATVGRLAREVQETATRRHMETGFVIIHKYQEMPQAILRDFERVIEVHRVLLNLL